MTHTLDMTALAASLERVPALPNAAQRDIEFANDLLNGKWGLRQRGYLTDKQTAAALRMVDRLLGAKQEPTKLDLDLRPIKSFFRAAGAHLKCPKVVLSLDGTLDGDFLKIYVASQRSIQPGAINLVAMSGEDIWLGRILDDGSWQRRDTPNTAPFYERTEALLTKFAASPAQIAAEYGRLTGLCSFCTRSLTDARSTEVGYGKICARNFGLPWG